MEIPAETTGKRETTHPRYELVERVIIDRIAKVMTAGAEKYGDKNWQDFSQEQIDDIPRHALDHILQYMANDNNEDHLANCACNLMMLMWYSKVRKLKPSYRFKGTESQEELLKMVGEGKFTEIPTNPDGSITITGEK